ncbi:MAG: hypothetical protein U1D30_12835 [Planctomycetota bacterium]
MDRLTVSPENAGRMVEAFELAYAHGKETLDLRIGDRWERHSRRGICPGCRSEYPIPKVGLFVEGSPSSLPYRLTQHTFLDVLAMAVETAREFLESQSFTDARSRPLLEPILARMRYLSQVGLGYLSLDRKVVTLSTGEAPLP